MDADDELGKGDQTIQTQLTLLLLNTLVMLLIALLMLLQEIQRLIYELEYNILNCYLILHLAGLVMMQI